MHHHPISTFGTSVPLLPTGHEDLEGWAYRRARSCEATLSPMEVEDAGEEGVDVRAVWHDAYDVDEKPFRKRNNGFAKFNGRWHVPRGCTTIASGLDPATHPGEFIALDDAECAALERVQEHWRVQAEADDGAA